MSTSNPLKRRHSPTRDPRSHRLRTKLSPTALQHSDSSVTSAVSDDSALFSTDRASRSESQSTSVDSENSRSESSEADSDSDSGSEISDSSDDGSDASSSDADEEGEEEELGMITGERDVEVAFEETEDADGISRLAPKKHKPVIKATGTRRSGDLRARLKTFLPMMAAANEELEVERKEGRLEERRLDLGEGATEGEYIEMDLGLGVLEERDPNASDSESESESDDEAEGAKGMEKDILGKLMGQDKRAEGVGIEVVETV